MGICAGSNATSAFGSPRETVRAALVRVAEALGAPLRDSGLFSSPAFPAGIGPDFVNAVVAGPVALDPAEVLRRLHGIEAEFDRLRDVRWGQRTLDLDLLFAGDTVLPDRDTQDRWRGLAPDRQAVEAPEQLILPHPRMQDRAFVLVPLAAVAPDWQHPTVGLSVAQMLARLPAEDVASIRPLA